MLVRRTDISGLRELDYFLGKGQLPHILPASVDKDMAGLLQGAKCGMIGHSVLPFDRERSVPGNNYLSRHETKIYITGI